VTPKNHNSCWLPPGSLGVRGQVAGSLPQPTHAPTDAVLGYGAVCWASGPPRPTTFRAAWALNAELSDFGWSQAVAPLAFPPNRDATGEAFPPGESKLPV